MCQSLGRQMNFLLQEPAKVKILKNDFFDEKRERKLPVKIYAPENPSGKLPCIFWSHGLGGGRDGAAFLGRFISEQGFIVVHMTHIGTDTSIWEGKPGHPWDVIQNRCPLGRRQWCDCRSRTAAAGSPTPRCEKQAREISPARDGRLVGGPRPRRVGAGKCRTGTRQCHRQHRRSTSNTGAQATLGQRALSTPQLGRRNRRRPVAGDVPR